MSNGFGEAAWWGFSPALDLLQQANLDCPKGSEQDFGPSDGVKLLLVGAADLRHVIRTLEKSKQHTSRPLHFYVVEHSMETLARHMLFLSLISEPAEKLGLQEKVELFMELFGNVMVRPQSDQYLKRKATELIRVISDDNSLPFLDVSMLKYKDKDALEAIFKRWRAPPPTKTTHPNKTQQESYWDVRIRNHLGTRYDTRRGVFDWDYHMKLSGMAPPLSCREYVHWREVGVAFQLRLDASYDVLNNTLLSYKLVRHGLHDIPVCGYWGDIVSSPFLSFGIDSEDTQLMKDHTGEELKKSSQLVTEHNLLSSFYQLLTGDPYKSTPSIVSLPVVMEDEEREELEREEEGNTTKLKEVEVEVRRDREGKVEEKKNEECSGSKEEPANTANPQGPLLNGSCQIFFLSPSLISDMAKKAHFKNLFKVAYFSNSMVHTMKDGIEAVFAPNCEVITETAEYILDLTKEQKTQFVTKSTELANNAGLKLSSCSPGTTHLHFLAQPTRSLD